MNSLCTNYYEQSYSNSAPSYTSLSRYRDILSKNDYNLVYVSFLDKILEINSSFFEETYNLKVLKSPYNVKPMPKLIRKAKVMMEKNKTDFELFREAYDELEAEDISKIDIKGFISYCEGQYKMSTIDFIKWFEENGHEGNVDMQLWYLYAKNIGGNHE